MAENALEAALARAFADPATRDEFYRTLLESRVYFLTSAPVSEGKKIAEEETNVPLVALTGPDGGALIPMFSSEEYAREFSQGKANIIGLAGSSAFKMLAGAALPAMLDPQTSKGKMFSLDEIKAILPMLGDEQKMAAGTEVQIGQPARYPDEIAAALKEVFANYPNVEAAYIALIHIPSSGQPPHLLIGVKGTVLREAFSSAALAARRAGGDQIIDFASLSDGENTLTDYFRTGGVTPFFTRRP